MTCICESTSTVILLSRSKDSFAPMRPSPTTDRVLEVCERLPPAAAPAAAPLAAAPAEAQSAILAARLSTSVEGDAAARSSGSGCCVDEAPLSLDCSAMRTLSLRRSTCAPTHPHHPPAWPTA